MHEIIIERWGDPDRELSIWLFGSDRGVIADHGTNLIEALKAVNDFIPGVTLLVFPIKEPLPYGEVFRNHYFINPLHITEPLPHVFACTDSLISSYAGNHGAFFEDPANPNTPNTPQFGQVR